MFNLLVSVGQSCPSMLLDLVDVCLMSVLVRQWSDSPTVPTIRQCPTVRQSSDNRPTVVRQSSDSRPTVVRQSGVARARPHSPTVVRQSDSRPTVVRQCVRQLCPTVFRQCRTVPTVCPTVPTVPTARAQVPPAVITALPPPYRLPRTRSVLLQE